MARKYGVQDPEKDQRIEMICGGCNNERGHVIIEEAAQRLKEAILAQQDKENVYISSKDLLVLRTASPSNH